MKASDDLFQLIKSLTKSEKRYFKVSNPKKNNDLSKNNYLRLFDAIEQQDIYDESKIVKQFADRTFIKHLPSEKNYLYNLISRSLHLFHTHSSRETILDELLHFSEILYNKGLFLQSKKVLNKARQIAIENEKNLQLIAISKQRVRLAKQLSNSYIKLEKEQADAATDSKLAIQKIINENEYQELFDQFFFLIRKEGELIREPKELKEFNIIFDNPLIKNEGKAITYRSKEIFYWIKSIYYYIIGELDLAYLYGIKELEHFESHPEQITEQSLYTAKLNNICEICLRMKKHKEFWLYLNQLKETPAKSELEKGRKFYRYYDLALRFYVGTGEFKKGISLVNIIEEELKAHEKHVHKSRLISIYYYIGYAYFGMGDYKSSLRWINKILNDSKSDLRRDILGFARILNFIIHFELHHTLLLEHIIKSTHHFLHTRKKIYRLEILALKFLKKLSETSEENKQKPLMELRNELISLSKDPFERLAFEYFDLLSWTESKIEGNSFTEVIRAKIS